MTEGVIAFISLFVTNKRKFQFILTLPFFFLLIGCGDVVGPENVPGNSIYTYATEDCDNPISWAATNGTVVGNSRTLSASIKWDEGPAIGEAIVTCDGDEESMEVNIFRVDIENARIRTGTVTDRGERGGFRIVISSGPPSINAGTLMTADITVEGPNGNEEIDRITVGFYQRLSDITIWEAEYGNQRRRLIAQLHPDDTLPLNDYAQSGGPAWYDPDPPVVFNPTETDTTGEISMRDSPSTSWPALHTISEEILEFASTEFVFDTLICSWSSDAEDVYTVHAFKIWSFQAGYILGESQDGALAGEIVPRRVGTARQNEFTLVTDGDRCEPRAGNTAVEAVRRVNWEDR